MVRVTLEEVMSSPPEIDREKLEGTTEEDIRRHMIEDGFDPDDTDWLNDAVVVRPPRQIRERLGMTQADFAQMIGSPLASYRNWEQGRTLAPPTVRVLLNIIDREPEAALRALGRKAA